MAFISGFGTGSAVPTKESANSGTGARVRLALAAGLTTLLLPGAAPVADLHVDVAKLRSAKGLVRLCLTADPTNFPACINDARAITRSVPAGTTAVTFGALPHGDYALAVIHDENGNAKLDTFAGVPREGFGFSRNPAIGFGPPRFTAARFTMGSDAQTQQVRMKYIF